MWSSKLKKSAVLFLFLINTVSIAQQKDNLILIDSLLVKGRYQQALKELSDSPVNFYSQEKIASIYYQIDKTREAILYYKKALGLKDDYKVKVQLGKSYQKLRDYANAIQTYEDILALDSENLLIKFQLGKLYLTKRKANKAIEIFKQLESSDAANPNYPYHRARGYAMKKERDSMIDTFLMAYKIDSTHIKSIYQLANSFFKLRETDSTFLFINQGLKVDPRHQNLLRLKVNQHFLLKDYKNSIATLKILDSLYPNSKFTNSMMGKSYFNSGNYKEAELYLKKAMEIDRNDHKIMTNLGHVSMKKEDYRSAFFHYRMAASLGKVRLDEEYYGLGNVYLKMDRVLEAIGMFEKAYEDNSRDHKILFQLAKTSDEYFNDKKKVYKYYREYVFRFDEIDKEMTNYANRRIKDIKKSYFMKGEDLGD